MNHLRQTASFSASCNTTFDWEWGTPASSYHLKGITHMETVENRIALETALPELFKPIPKTPQLNGNVERFFHRLNDSLIHSLPATTFSNVLANGGDDPVKDVVIRLSDPKPSTQ